MLLALCLTLFVFSTEAIIRKPQLIPASIDYPATRVACTEVRGKTPDVLDFATIFTALEDFSNGSPAIVVNNLKPSILAVRLFSNAAVFQGYRACVEVSEGAEDTELVTVRILNGAEEAFVASPVLSGQLEATPRLAKAFWRSLPVNTRLAIPNIGGIPITWLERYPNADFDTLKLGAAPEIQIIIPN